MNRQFTYGQYHVYCSGGSGSDASDIFEIICKHCHIRYGSHSWSGIKKCAVCVEDGKHFDPINGYRNKNDDIMAIKI